MPARPPDPPRGDLIPLGGLLLLAGRLGDLVGRRRMLLAGLVLFVVASIACALAPTAPALVAARALQGVAAALASSVVLGMIVALFDDPADRARAIGTYAFTGAAGASVGLLLGGVLTETVGWRAIFWINVPIGVAAVVLTRWAIRSDRSAGRQPRPDVPGALLVTLGLGALVAAIVESGTTRWTAAAAAVVLLAAFALRQVRAAAPLVPAAVWRARSVVLGNAAQILAVAAMMGFQFATALYLQQVLGFSPASTGFAMLPVAVAIGVVALGFAGPLVARFTARRVLLAGLALLVLGFAGLTVLPGTDYLVDVLPPLLLLGLGGGLVMPAVTTVVMADASDETAGLVSGLANTAQQVGGALGIAGLAAAADARTTALLADGVAALTAAGDGYRAAYAVASALVVAAAMVVWLTLRPAAPAPTRCDEPPAPRAAVG